MKTKKQLHAILVVCLMTLSALGCGDDSAATDAGPSDAGPSDAASDAGPSDARMDAVEDTSTDSMDGSLDDVSTDDAPADAGPPLLMDLVLTVDGSPLTLIPTFDPAISAYEAEVDTFVREVTVLATPDDPGVELEIEGRGATVGLPVDVGVSLGTHVLDIGYRLDGRASETRVTLTRNASLEAVDLPSTEDDGSRLGWRMATAVDLLVVGAPFEDVGGVADAGAAYVFRRTDGSWGLPTVITATVPQADARFGSAVATDGVRVAVGAFFEDIIHEGSLVMNAGAAYTFLPSGPASWVDDNRLTIASGTSEIPAENDQFGVSVSMGEGVLAVGSLTRDTTGVVFVYQRDGASWAEPQILRPNGVVSAARFGAVVFTIAGAYLVVGAPNERTSAGGIDPIIDEDAAASGAVFVFTRGAEAEPWGQTAMIKAAVPQAFDRFGASFAFDNLVLVVGAPGEDGGEAGAGHDDDDDGGSLDSGAVYRFRVAAGWAQEAYLKAEVNYAGANFGASVAHWGNLLVVGASQSDEQRGAASLVAFVGEDWVSGPELESTGALGDLFGTSAVVGRHGVVIGYPQNDTGPGGIRFFE